MKVVNSAGFSDYVNGFAPTVNAEEDIANLLPIGDTNETLLNVTINYINGNMKKSLELKSDFQFEKVADSKDFVPHSKEMHFNYKFKFH